MNVFLNSGAVAFPFITRWYGLVVGTRSLKPVAFSYVTFAGPLALLHCTSLFRGMRRSFPVEGQSATPSLYAFASKDPTREWTVHATHRKLLYKDMTYRAATRTELKPGAGSSVLSPPVHLDLQGKVTRAQERATECWWS